MNKYINRTIEKKIIEMSKSFPLIMLTGPRQVGKTTVLNILGNSIENKINYVTLDDMNSRILAVEDPELFFRTYKTPLIIDEFQYAPNILSYIKTVVDSKRLDNLVDSNIECNGLYYLTGSQAFRIMEGVDESLAGRVGKIGRAHV